MTEDASQAPKDIIGFLDFYLVKKAPAIPEAGRAGIVKWGPWIGVVLLALKLPSILTWLGFRAWTFPWGYYGYYSGFGVGVVLMIVYFGLIIAALPGLFARKTRGWQLMFYAEVTWVLGALFYGALANAIVGGLIAFYVLFQVRSKYH